MDIKKDLWITKYRPRSIEQYVWRDPDMRSIVEHWLKQQALPHCLFSGEQGTGKTSLALLLLDLLEIPEEDRLRVNASRDRKIEELQDKIINFIDAWTFNPTGLKYVLLDEADKLSQTAQGMLRGELETYAHTCRFILTCNYSRQIIPALHSRLQEIKFSTLDLNDFVMRVADILDQEDVRYEPEVLMGYVNATYPDMRKCLGVLQQNHRFGVLLKPTDEIDNTADHVNAMLNLFRRGEYREGRKLLIDKAAPEEYPGIFRTLYQNLALFGNETQQAKALLAIRDALLNHTVVADQEINMAACLVELALIAQ
jgi:DNA polymerase III delta prime subunit